MILAQAPQLLDNPCCEFINRLPWGFFLAVHVALFALGAYLAWRGFSARDRLMGTGFLLFAVGEVAYASYHVNITQFLFAHTIAEVLVGVAFVLLFAAFARRGIGVATAAREQVGAGR
jgi:hypothetical protein